ncbi:hypothetical protein, partial [Fervidobacterium sp.]
NLGTYSIECHRIIQMAALETEAVLYQMCKLRNGTCESGTGRTRPFGELLEHLRGFLEEHGLELGGIRVQYVGSLVVQPFPPGSPGNALPWWDAYTALKHRRHEALQKATLRHALQAVGALVTAVTALALLGRRGMADQQPLNLHPPPKTVNQIVCGDKLPALTAHIYGPPFVTWHGQIPPVEPHALE